MTNTIYPRTLTCGVTRTTTAVTDTSKTITLLPSHPLKNEDEQFTFTNPMHPKVRNTRLQLSYRIVYPKTILFVNTLLLLIFFGFGFTAVHAQDTEKYSARLNEFLPIAEAGDVDAQFIVALTYGISKYDGDLQRYEYWLERAAQQGHVKAQLRLGDLYRTLGPLQNYSKANVWLNKAAEQGNAGAEYLLGTMFYHGYGVEKNYLLAITWFEKSANQGEKRAQGILGNMYFQGQGVPQNYLQSIYWFQKAGEQGDTIAMSALGLIYEAGLGVEKSLALAHVMYNLALANGRESSATQKDLFRIGGQLTVPQLLQAQKIAAQWKVGNPLPSIPPPPRQEKRKKRVITS